MADPYSAGQVLGSALFGNTRGTYNDELGRAYKVEQALQQARKSRSDAILANQINEQRALVNPELVTGVLGGDRDALGTLGSISLLANDKFDAGQLTDVLGAAARSGARDSALGGDWAGANANLMAVANGPQELAAVQGQNLLNNRFVPGAGGISTTDQGRAGMAADAARARASDASAASSYASAARTKQAMTLDRADVLGSGATRGGGGKAPSGYRWLPDGGLQAIPGGPADKPAGAGGEAGGDLNPRQRVAVQGVQRNLLEYASALTGTPMEQLRQMDAAKIGELVEQNGGRFVQGGTARTLGKLPGGQLLGDVSNADILSYSQGAGAAWAAYENPTGMITNADRETSTAQMPTYLDPPEVQARKLRSFLELSGYQPAGGGTLGDAPRNRAPTAPVRAQGLPAASGAGVDDLLGKYGIR